MFDHDLGRGISLGPLEPWHAEQFLAAVDRDRAHMDQLPFSYAVRTIDDARAFLQRFAVAHAHDERHLVGIWDGAVLVGLVMFPDFNVALRRCEVGVWISTDYEGRGLVTAAVRHVLGWAFDERGMSRVQWTNDPANDRSRAVAKRTGFSFEAILRNNFVPVPGGPSIDAELWSITAEDWRGLRTGA